MPMPADNNDTPRAIETAMDQVGSGVPAQDALPPGGESSDANTPADDALADEAPADGQTGADADPDAARPGSKVAALLESLTEAPAGGQAGKAAAEAAPAGAPAAAKPGDKPAGAPASDKPAGDQEEAELLDGVKSERGRERIKSVFKEKKQLETDIGEFRQLINSTGMQPQDFAQTLEFGRLVNSGNEADTRVALEMLEAQRTALYAKLGVEAPGVDLLTGHADLQKQVTDLEITRERAVELAKFRKSDGERVQRETRQREAQQGQQEFQQTVTTAAGQMEAYLETRKAEVDHPARMRVISDHFRDPVKLKAFVETYRPDQWGPTMKMMYDNIKLAPQVQHQRQQQPLRSRPAHLGAPAASGVAPIDRIASRMDAMGL